MFWIKLFSQVSDVAYGPLLYYIHIIYLSYVYLHNEIVVHIVYLFPTYFVNNSFCKYVSENNYKNIQYIHVYINTRK